MIMITHIELIADLPTCMIFMGVGHKPPFANDSGAGQVVSEVSDEPGASFGLLNVQLCTAMPEMHRNARLEGGRGKGARPEARE